MKDHNNFKFTVITPTYNRAHTLLRVYNSLLAQTYSEFIWLIVDDGSTDDTKYLVNQWMKDGRIFIRYIQKSNGGKHTAIKLAHEKAFTKYIVEIDSDDELTPDALEVFNEAWNKINMEGFQDQIAVVNALSRYTDKSLVGNYLFSENKDFEDSYWHNMVLKKRNYNEQISSMDLEKIKTAIYTSDNIWLSDKINFFAEFVLWARIGRKYKTRYLNKYLRIYHLDAGESLLRMSRSDVFFYNNLVGNKYFIEENLSYIHYQPIYFFNLLIKLLISSIELRISPIEILKNTSSITFRIVLAMNYPIGLTAWLYFKYFKKKFW